jgi:hypothetical protein
MVRDCEFPLALNRVWVHFAEKAPDYWMWILQCCECLLPSTRQHKGVSYLGCCPAHTNRARLASILSAGKPERTSVHKGL